MLSFCWQNECLMLIGISIGAYSIHTDSFFYVLCNRKSCAGQEVIHSSQMASSVTVSPLRFLHVFFPKIWCTMKAVQTFVQLAWTKHRQLAVHQTKCNSLIMYGGFPGFVAWVWLQRRGRGERESRLWQILINDSCTAFILVGYIAQQRLQTYPSAWSLAWSSTAMITCLQWNIIRLCILFVLSAELECKPNLDLGRHSSACKIWPAPWPP